MALVVAHYATGVGLMPPSAPAHGPVGASSTHDVSGLSEAAQGLKQRVTASIMVVEDLNLGLTGGSIRHLSVEGSVHLSLTPPRDNVPLVFHVMDKHAQVRCHLVPLGMSHRLWR
jgi:hypothetical protein